MKLTAILLLLASPVLAQSTSTTYFARVEGTANSRSVTVEVRQTLAASGSSTTLFYRIAQADNTTIAEGFGPIPASAYKVNGNTHTLLATTQHGTIALTWRPTTVLQSTYSSQATERRNNVVTNRTSEDQSYSSSAVDGTAIGVPLTAGDREAHVTTLVVKR